MIPLSTSELSTFTPASLANVPAPPVFSFRPVSPRDKRAYQKALMVEGLTIHSHDDIRAIMVRELGALWDEAVAETELARVRATWAAMDQNLDLSIEDLQAYLDLETRIGRVSKDFRQAVADNRQFNDDAPKIALSLFLVGWKKLTTPFRRSDGAVPLDTLDAVQAELTAAEATAISDNIEGVGEPGLAFNQLALHAFTLLGLTDSELGKSESLSPSPVVPQGSELTSPPAANGKLRGARSKKTPLA